VAKRQWTKLTCHYSPAGENFPTVRRGSPAAMAPEVLSAFAAATWPGVWRGRAATAPVRPDAPDMWAAGCMLAQLLATGIAVRSSRLGRSCHFVFDRLSPLLERHLGWEEGV